MLEMLESNLHATAQVLLSTLAELEITDFEIASSPGRREEAHAVVVSFIEDSFETADAVRAGAAATAVCDLLIRFSNGALNDAESDEAAEAETRRNEVARALWSVFGPANGKSA